MRAKPGPVPGVPCARCGAHRLRIEMRLELRPLGTFSLAGQTMKGSARDWPYMVCDGCGESCRGKADSLTTLTYFGEKWDAPILLSAEQVDTPVDQKCLYCPDRILEGEQGVVLPYVGTAEETGAPTFGRTPAHRECFLRAAVGSVECYRAPLGHKPGDHPEPEGNWRQQGRELMAYFEEVRRADR